MHSLGRDQAGPGKHSFQNWDSTVGLSSETLTATLHHRSLSQRFTATSRQHALSSPSRRGLLGVDTTRPPAQGTSAESAQLMPDIHSRHTSSTPGVCTRKRARKSHHQCKSWCALTHSHQQLLLHAVTEQAGCLLLRKRGAAQALHVERERGAVHPPVGGDTDLPARHPIPAVSLPIPLVSLRKAT